MTADQFVSHLEKARQTGSQRWIACCPAHKDKSPSMSVAEGNDGRVLIHCFAGCGIEEIVGALGLTIADIMPERPIDHHFKPIRKPFPAADVLACLRTESMIVYLAGCDLARGKELTPEAMERLDVAAARIEAAANA